MPREFLAAGLVDHLHVVQVPILLGRGVRLWDGLEALDEQYDVEAVSTPSGVTHLPPPDEGRDRQRWVAGGCRCGLTAPAPRDWCLISGPGASTELFSSLAEAKLILAECLEGYNSGHPHSSLGMLPPAPFAAA